MTYNKSGKERKPVFPQQTVLTSPSDFEHRMSGPSERTSLSVFHRASLTLEAALVLPLFLFSVLTILYFCVVIRQASAELVTFGERAKQAATAVTVFSDDQKIIDLIWKKSYSFPFRLIPVPGVSITFRARVRAWTGRDGYIGQEEEEEESEQEEQVYVTPTGSVYHRNLQCSYLKLSIRTVSYAEIEALRNEGNAKYYPCERCGGSPGASVYVTSYGNRYHSTLDCSGLKRTVETVPISQAKETKRPCSKCG